MKKLTLLGALALFAAPAFAGDSNNGAPIVPNNGMVASNNGMPSDGNNGAPVEGNNGMASLESGGNNGVK